MNSLFFPFALSSTICVLLLLLLLPSTRCQNLIAVEVGVTIRLPCRTIDDNQIFSSVWIAELSGRPLEKLFVDGKIVDRLLRYKYSLDSSFDLIVRDVSLDDSGRYRCNRDRSQYLSVIATPKCAPFPATDVIVDANSWRQSRWDAPSGALVERRCVVEYVEPWLGYERPSPSVEWRRNGSEIVEGGKAWVQQLGAHHKLVVLSLRWSAREVDQLTCVVVYPFLRTQPPIIVERDGFSGINVPERALRTLAAPSCEAMPLVLECPTMLEVADDQLTETVLQEEEMARDRIMEAMESECGSTACPVFEVANSSRSTRNHRGPPILDNSFVETMTKHKLAIICTASGNPLPPVDHFLWNDFVESALPAGSNDDVEKVLYSGLRGGPAVFAYFVKSEKLRARPEFDVGFSVLDGRLERLVRVRYQVGPYLLCPQHVYLSGRKRLRMGRSTTLDAETEDDDDDVSFVVKCVVRVHPPLEKADISWTLKPLGKRRLVKVKTDRDVVDRSLEIFHVTPASPSSSRGNVSLVNLAILRSRVKDTKAKYLLGLHVEKNSKFASASVQIQWDGAWSLEAERVVVLICLALSSLVVNELGLF